MERNLVNPPKKRKYALRSWCWQYYEIDKRESSNAICCICRQSIKTYSSSTTELIKHLQKHHVTESTDVASAMQQVASHLMQVDQLTSPDLDDIADNDSDTSGDSAIELSTPFNQRKHERIITKLVKFVVCNNLSFQIIDSRSFHDFLGEFTKRYKLPCRQTFRNTYLPNIVSYIYIYKPFFNIKIV